jgi:hypothetical protein
MSHLSKSVHTGENSQILSVEQKKNVKLTQVAKNHFAFATALLLH